MRRYLPALCLLMIGCASSSRPASETLPALKSAIAYPVRDDLTNKQNSALVEEVSEAAHLQGLTRTQVQDALGKGDDCGRHPLCAEQGFLDDDWYYEVGTMGENYLRARPVLIVGFDRFGKVTRTFNVRIE